MSLKNLIFLIQKNQPEVKQAVYISLLTHNPYALKPIIPTIAKSLDQQDPA